MKGTNMVVCVVVVLGVMLSLGGCAPGKYTPKPDEEIYGTWTNPNYAQQKYVKSPDGTFASFSYPDDTVPFSSGTYQLVRKWKDAEGNTWYHENFRVLKGVYTFNGQQLDKIDKAGKVLEVIYLEVGQFDPRNYPRQLDPTSESYGMFHRQGN